MTPNVTELTAFFKNFPTPFAASVGSQSSASLASSPSSFELSASPADLLNGTLSGLTLTAAALGSPTLAKICSHPLFAGAALYLGASHQIQAWGRVDGLISGALLLLSSVSTLISGYSFYRGIKAGWQSLKEATRLAVYDRVRDLQQQVTSALDQAIARTDHAILKEARKLSEETHGDVKAAAEHFKDLRDEKPQRIEAAKQSSLAAVGQAAPEPHLIIRDKAGEARRTAMDAASKAALTARLTPAMLSRVRDNHGDETASLIREAMETSLSIERLLESSSAKGSVVSRLFALRSSPLHRRFVRKTVVQAEEAQRVASMSPRNWISEARADALYSPAEKKIGHWLGRAANGGLLYAVPFLATVQALVGGYDYAQGQISGGGFLNQLVTSLLSLTPAAVTYLYNARQGRRRFNVSPAATQELPFERYGEAELQERTSRRLDKAVPPLEPSEEERFIEGVRKTQAKNEVEMKDLEALDVPRPTGISAAPAADTSWLGDRDRSYTPIERPDPQRPYRYDYRRGAPDTEEKKRIRTAVKAMSLEQLEDAIRYGDVTHVDLFNMIRDHAVSRDGAILPRPIEGRLARRLLKMAVEADRTGVIRHFLMVKDLFPGIDGVVTAGSKTAYFTDLGKSPLVQRIIEQGFIPIPCGLTAGANGGSGLYNGHGAVGNPKIPLHDTAGSSSAEAYVLGLEDFPVRLAIGTDTGGSISAPCGAVKLFGWVPEKGMFSRVNMLPYATYLDTPGVMGVDRREVLSLARQLTIPAYQSRYEAPPKNPTVYYFETDVALASPEARLNFSKQLQALRDRGLAVVALGKRFSSFRQIPLDLYPDSYVGAAFTLMNPLEENRWGEAPRFVLDRNLQNRLAKANVLLKTSDGEHGNLFNHLLDLHIRFRDLFQRKFPAGSVFVSPTPEAVPLDDFKPNGPAGTKLDSHDVLGGMLKNRVDNALSVDPERGLVIEGRTGEILAVMLGRKAVTVETIEAKLQERFPSFTNGHQPVGHVLAKMAFKAWEADGHPPEADDVTGRYVEAAVVSLYEMLQMQGNLELLDKFRSQDRKNLHSNLS